MTAPAVPPPAPAADRPFSTGAAWALVLVVGGSLLAAFLLLVFRGEGSDRISVGADTYSRSALGHHTLFELLRETGRPVTRSRNDSGLRAHRGLLVVAEPYDLRDGELQRTMRAAESVLLVLPKRSGSPDRLVRHWVGDHGLLPLDGVQNVLGEISRQVSVRRANEVPSEWQFRGSMPELPLPQLERAQVLTGSGCRPLVANSAGALVAEIETAWHRTFVLADPDVLANHGIGDGDNARFVLGLLDALREGDGIVIDETLHGFEIQPSPWVQLGRFPLVLLLVHGLLLLALVAWLAHGRFGPLLAPSRAFAPDVQLLLDNTARLLLHGGHTGHSATQLFRDRLRRTARRLGLPPGTDAWLQERLQARATALGRLGFADLCTRMAGLALGDVELGEHAAVLLARQIHRELEGLEHGNR